jgi:hypothetical protein
MATPLAQLLDIVMSDTEARADFARSPEAFMSEHGYQHLDADDVQEALFVLADGSPPAEAGALIESGRAIDDLDASERHGLDGAIAGLGNALHSLFGGDALDVIDPAELDDVAADDDSGDPTAADVSERDDDDDDQDDEDEPDDLDDQDAGGDRLDPSNAAVSAVHTGPGDPADPADPTAETDETALLDRDHELATNDDGDAPGDLGDASDGSVDDLDGLGSIEDSGISPIDLDDLHPIVEELPLSPEPLPPVPEEFDDGWGDVII